MIYLFLILNIIFFISGIAVSFAIRELNTENIGLMLTLVGLMGIILCIGIIIL